MRKQTTESLFMKPTQRQSADDALNDVIKPNPLCIHSSPVPPTMEKTARFRPINVLLGRDRQKHIHRQPGKSHDGNSSIIQFEPVLRLAGWATCAITLS